ncbi:MAG: ABC transporter permease [Planctomycetota bacterium]|jgi:putative ABC transport system permease protein
MTDEMQDKRPVEAAKTDLSGFEPPFPYSPLRLVETLSLGVQSLKRHKLRSLLTMLGIVFGVGAVVSMMSVVAGASQEQLDEIHKLGTQNILLKSVRPPERAEASQQTSWIKEFGLKERDLAVMDGAVPGIKKIIRTHEVAQKAYLGNKRLEPTVLGVEPEYFDALHVKVARGRIISAVDEADLATVCVVGPGLYRSLGGVGDPLGQIIRVGDTPFEICGVLEGREVGSERLKIFLPRRTAMQKFGLLQARIGSGSMEAFKVEVSEAILRCEDHNSVLPAAIVVEHVLKRLHDSQDYEIQVPMRLLEQAERTQRVFQVVMVLIAGISLIVGGIGIANIMFAGVMERTREIGIRRALGARKGDVLVQFLMETVLMALAGGIVGCLLGVAGTLGIGSLTGWPIRMNLQPFVLALLISCVVGVVSGLAPARRASRLDPVAALRYE